jgi:hypothetical protein
LFERDICGLSGVKRSMGVSDVHDLNPRAMSQEVRGFVSPQSWFVDLTLVRVQ